VDPPGRDHPVALLVWVDPLTPAWGDPLARDPPVAPLFSSDRTAAAAAVAAAVMAAFQLVWVDCVVGFYSQSEVLDTRVHVLVSRFSLLGMDCSGWSEGRLGS
jgi:hypothetical protein